MKTSVIIPLWNKSEETLEKTEKCFRSLVNNTVAEMVIVDNGSSYPLKLAEDHPGTKYYRWTDEELQAKADYIGVQKDAMDGNAGIACAWNKGVELASGDVVIFANSDIVVKADWLPPLINILGMDKVAVASPVTLRTDEEYVSNLASPERFEAQKVTGGCFALLRETYEKIGPFDEKIYPAFFEDTDYWLRTIRMGFMALASSKSMIKHPGRTSCRQARNWQAMWRRNRNYVERKHGVELIPTTGFSGAERALGDAVIKRNHPHLVQNV